MKVDGKLIWNGEPSRLMNCSIRPNAYRWCRENWCPGKIDGKCLIGTTGDLLEYAEELYVNEKLSFFDKRRNNIRIIRVKKR